MGLIADKPGAEVVKAREFDVTQYGKWMAGLIGVLTPAIVGALKLFKVEQVTEPVVIAALGVTAVAVFSVSLVISVDMLARAIVTRGAANDDPPLAPDEEVHRKTKETRVSRA